MHSTLKFVIVGHVDHGKSTLIGRLLFDTNSLPLDRMKEVEDISKQLGRETEFAFLLDHLQEEREQGITIDTTQIFFKTDKRDYVIIDAPGHVEFVKNMITGASQAEAAFLIVDAHEGIQEQTKRHAYILAMLGLEQVIVLLNKMDLLDFDQAQFDGVRKQAQRFLDSIGMKALHYIPICALKGDNVADRSKNMHWYTGPTVLESLDSLRSRPVPEDKPLIFPVQDVYKVDGKRIAVGRVETGAIGKEPPLSDEFRANILWMSKREFNKQERVILRCATQETSCVIKKIEKRIDSSTLEVIEKHSDHLQNLEVGEVVVKTKKPIAVNTFNDIQELGRFVLVRNENVCAGGIVTEVR